MNNQFCIKKDDLVKIFWEQKATEMTNQLLQLFRGSYSYAEINQQINAGEGEVAEYFKRENNIFSKKTLNVETVHSITLADFYFPDSNPLICFEMKSSFVKKEVEDINDVFENIEPNTVSDCVIRDDGHELKFQLKQYPEEYKEWSAEKVIEYLDSHILPESEYNNANNSDLIIIIAIKPKRPSSFQGQEDFDKIYKYLQSRTVHLGEISFIYNQNSEYMIWHQVCPENGHSRILWKNLSYHKAKKPV